MPRRSRPVIFPEAVVPDFISYLDIRQAILAREFELEYQPIVSLGSGLIERLEALVRWRHPKKGGHLAPDVFLPKMERTTLMQRLTQQVLRDAVAQCSLLHREGFMLGVAVNVSPSAVTEKLPEHVGEALVEHVVDPFWLTLEITQSVAFQNLGRASTILKTIKAGGVRTSLDDFGASKSSVPYLQCLAFDEIKIDRSLVSRAGRWRSGADEVRRAVDLAHERGLRSIGEGVEDERTLSLLTAYGVDAAQGHVFSPALPPGELLTALPDISSKAYELSSRRPIDVRGGTVERIDRSENRETRNTRGRR